eukprot:scpid27044/ scgid19132/ 
MKTQTWRAGARYTRARASRAKTNTCTHAVLMLVAADVQTMNLSTAPGPSPGVRAIRKIYYQNKRENWKKRRDRCSTSHTRKPEHFGLDPSSAEGGSGNGDDDDSGIGVGVSRHQQYKRRLRFISSNYNQFRMTLCSQMRERATPTNQSCVFIIAVRPPSPR